MMQDKVKFTDKRMLQRPRIDELLEEGVKHTLVKIVAAIGYGKTEAVSSFIKKYEDHIWLSLTAADRSVKKYWNHIVKIICDKRPDLSESLEKYECPDTVSRLDLFIQFINTALAGKNGFIVVLDNYSIIKNTKTEQFMKFFVENNIDKLKIIVISNSTIDLDFYCLKGGGTVFQIAADQLRFTFDETQAFFSLHNITLSQPVFKKINELIHGWAIALKIIVFYMQTNPGLCENNICACMSPIYNIIENEYFLPYDSKIKYLLLKLSLLDSFSLDMAIDIGGCDSQQTREVLESNLMIQYNLTKHQYFFHSMYKEFLAKRRPELKEVEKKCFFVSAGNWLYKNGKIKAAISCYFESKCFDKMIEIIITNPDNFNNNKQNEYLLKCLRQLPQEYVSSTPLVNYLIAIILLDLYKIKESKDLLKNLERQIKKSENNYELLGEVYIALAEISRLSSATDFVSLYKKAYLCLPKGSKIRMMNKFFINNSLLFIENSEYGALFKVEEAFCEAMPYIQRVMGNYYLGIDDLFAAESAYYTFNFCIAKKKAHQAIFKAMRHNRYDITGHAHYILAKTALISGNLNGILEQIRLFNEEITGKTNTSFSIQKENIENWFYIVLGDLKKVDSLMLEYKTSQLSAGKIIIYASYLFFKEKYYELLAFLNDVDELCISSGFWFCRLYAHIIRAVCSLKLDDKESAIDEFFKAYNMSYKNNIITPFVEIGTPMRNIIDVAKRNTKYIFDTTWMNIVYTKCSSYAKRLKEIKRIYAKENNIEPEKANNILSKKESYILKNLAEGFTKEEIADFYNISEHTAREHIKNIYNKLGAANRAEAVHIAHMIGVFEMPNKMQT